MIHRPQHQPFNVPYRSVEVSGKEVPYTQHGPNHQAEIPGVATQTPANTKNYAGSIDSTGMTEIKGIDPANAPTTNYFGRAHGDMS